MGHKDYHYVLLDRAKVGLDAIDSIEGGLGNQSNFDGVNKRLRSAINRLTQILNERLGIE